MFCIGLVFYKFGVVEYGRFKDLSLELGRSVSILNWLNLRKQT